MVRGGRGGRGGLVFKKAKGVQNESWLSGLSEEGRGFKFD